MRVAKNQAHPLPSFIGALKSSKQTPKTLAFIPKGLPAIDGIIVSRDFAEQHPKEMQKLVDLWFETIRYMKVNVAERSTIVRDYLRGKASVDYSADEYAIAWTFQYFPDSRQAAKDAFLTPGNTYFWKTIWDSNSEALVSQKKISEAVPESYFWGERTLQ